VLMIGDRLTLSLEKYRDVFVQAASKNITEPIKFEMFAKKGLGLHRTLAILRSLPSIPKLVIYYGASEEFHETRAHPLHYQTFVRNQTLLKNEVVSSIIIAWPQTSRVIYEPYQRYQFRLDEEIKNGPVIGAAKGKVEQMEMMFKIFEWEFEELALLSKEKNFNLLVVTPPINLMAQPKAPCSYSDDPTIRLELDKLSKQLASGKSKEAYDALKIVADQTVANAQALFLLGKAAYSLNRLSEARAALTKAAAVDCGTWRPNPVVNGIIRTLSQRHGLTLVDYDEQLNSLLGQNVLFFDAINPQNIYNSALMEKLGEATARALNL